MTKGRGTSQLVVTADDFGLSPGVDHGILDAYRLGIVRSTALLVNFPDISESVARLCQEPGLEVGIHLNLTAGPPVLPAEQLPSLVGSDGTFHNFSNFFARVARSRINWDQVALEWRAQFARGINEGCRFTFITSHQHVHMLPEGARICAMLAHEFGIDAVRLANFRLSEMLSPLRPKALALAPLVPAVRGIFQRSGVFFNKATLEIPPLNPDSALRQICGTLERLNPGVHELVCHPAYEDAMLEARDTYVAGRRNELTVLRHVRLRAFLENSGITTTTFSELSASMPPKGSAFEQNHSVNERLKPVAGHS